MPGDVLVFYIAGLSARVLVGEGIVASPATLITEESPATFDRRFVSYLSWRVPLVSCKSYKPELGLDFIEQLALIKDSDVERKYIGLLLRSACRKMSHADLDLIRKSTVQTEWSNSQEQQGATPKQITKRARNGA